MNMNCLPLSKFFKLILLVIAYYCSISPSYAAGFELASLSNPTEIYDVTGAYFSSEGLGYELSAYGVVGMNSNSGRPWSLGLIYGREVAQSPSSYVELGLALPSPVFGFVLSGGPHYGEHEVGRQMTFTTTYLFLQLYVRQVSVRAEKEVFEYGVMIKTSVTLMFSALSGNLRFR